MRCLANIIRRPSEKCARVRAPSHPVVSSSATAAPGHLPDPGIETVSLVSLCPLPWQAGSSHRAPWAASEACSSVRYLRGERLRVQHPDHEASSRDEQAPLVCACPQNCCPDCKQLWEFCERGRVVRSSSSSSSSLLSGVATCAQHSTSCPHVVGGAVGPFCG